MIKFIKVIKNYVVPLLAAVILGYVVLLLVYTTSPIKKNGAKVIVNIPPGANFQQIIDILEQKGIVTNRILFHSLTIVKRARWSLRAGEYELDTMKTPYMVIDQLLRGKIKTYPVIIPEDLTVREIAARLIENKLINEKVFMKLARDDEFLASLNIKAGSIEGYLFPDTYFFNRSMDTRQIMRMMVAQFWKKVTPEMLQKAHNMGFNAHEFITLASIIGKESGNAAEKPKISAVFHNRLKRKMRLQSDPTAVYDLENFSGAVLRSHLNRNSPYNTYVINGLPPGPIANPGLDSLQATLYPDPVDYLYFVAKGDGTHYFSSSLDMHQRRIYQFRRRKK